MSDPDDFQEAAPIEVRFDESAQSTQCSFWVNSILFASLVIIVVIIIFIVSKAKGGFSAYRDSPMNHPVDADNPQFVLPFDGKTSGVTPEDVVALWNDYGAVQDFEYSDGSKYYQSAEGILKEAPTEDILWAQYHSYPDTQGDPENTKIIA